jgi:hypothetical protein
LRAASAAARAILSAVTSSPASPAALTSGQHRYGLVLLLATVGVIDVIVSPDTPLSRGIALLIQGVTLLVVIVTSREERAVRRAAATLSIAVVFAVAVAVALSAIPRWLASLTAAITVIVVIVVLVRGVAQLITNRGVTLQAVAGALAIYLLVGFAFGLVISVVARLGPTYFAQGREGSLSEQVYFSFTTMTTTGYGDLTPARSVGHALAVLEMLIGQIYLVTVIGLLVGNLNRRSASRPGNQREA